MTSPSGYDTYSAMINVLKRKPDSTEAELSMPTVNLVNAVSEPVDVSVRHEQSLPDPNDHRRSKRPDLQVRTGDDVRVIGYVELKHITKPADPQQFSDAHDKRQWGSFKSLPNIVYSNGVAATLWRDGKLVASASVKDEGNWVSLWRLFLLYTPQIDSAPDALAVTMGLRVRLLREAVADALADGNDDLHRLFGSWKGLLATDFEEDAFADNFAQTTMAGLLLAKGLASPTQAAAFGLSVSEEVLRLAGHAVLAEVLDHVDKAARKDPVLDIHVTSIVDAVAAVDQRKPSDDDWWVDFYEPFVREYDKKLQQNRGVFYTPSQIVDYQIRCADWVLRNHLHKQDGFADSDVIALDPACGTGTYLTRLVEHVVAVTREQRGDGAVQEAVGCAVKNLYGFEVMVAPYTITRMRLATKCQTYGAELADNRVILTDTLSSPSAQLTLVPMFNDAIAEEQHQANLVKDKDTRVTVVVGNPPYDRDQSQARADPADRGSELRFGGIVRHGDGNVPALIGHFREKTPSEGRRQFHTCYELATYFWRWAIWKVCEQKHPGNASPGGPGIVSFISPSAWLRSDPWAGMRAHMRQKFDHVWVVDLGGDHRAAIDDGENVFPIQTPVCVTIAVRVGAEQPTKPASVLYRKLVGSKADKLQALTEVSLDDDDGWETASTRNTDRFLPVGPDDWYSEYRSIDKVLGWGTPGVQYNRSWPIGLTANVLQERWNRLAKAATLKEKEKLFKKSSDRHLQLDKAPAPLPTYEVPSPTQIAELSTGDPCEQPVPYGYRLFDTRKAIPDSRLGDRMRPKLWEWHSRKQAYLVAPGLTEPPGEGPTAVVFTDIPDKHSHHGRGGVVFPLWRNRTATDANADEGTVRAFSERYGCSVSSEEVWHYCAGLLGTDAYHRCFGEPMRYTLKPHVVLPEDHADFVELVNVGRRLVEISRRHLLNPSGVKCESEVDPTCLPVFNDSCYDRGAETLVLGGGRFTGVTAAIWDHEVSGYRTLPRWIKARSVKPGGRRSSPLDDIQPGKWTFTNELIYVCDQIVSLNHAAVIAEPILQRIVASNRPDNE